jgi:hypothetical protein
MKTCIWKVSQFHILIILLLFIILILFFIFITKKSIDFFETQTNNPNPVLNANYNQLVESRKAYLKELDQEFNKFAAKHKDEINDFIKPKQIIESKIDLSNVSYEDTIKKFYAKEKENRKKEELVSKKEESQKGNIYNLSQYKNLMLNNNKQKLFKKTLNNIKILKNDCYSQCDLGNCQKLDAQTKLVERCMKCNLQKNKCFHKTIIGGECDDCDGVDIKDKLDCLAIANFGCPNPDSLDDLRGVDPYYFMLNDNSPVSPFNKKCVFCWQIGDII